MSSIERMGCTLQTGGGHAGRCRSHLLASLPQSSQEVDHHRHHHPDHHHHRQHHTRGEKKSNANEDEERKEDENTFDWLHSTHL